MKKAEAISILATSVRPREAKDRERYDKAVNMAIEALKAQELKNVPDTNVGGMISRQAAIDALDVLCQEHRYKIPGKRETYSQYNEAWQDALDRAEGAIGNLPSVQPEIVPCGDCKHWICHDKRCGYWNHGVQPLMWCSQAERRWRDDER